MDGEERHLQGVHVPECMARAMGFRARMTNRMDRLLVNARELSEAKGQLGACLSAMTGQATERGPPNQAELARMVAEIAETLHYVQSLMEETATTSLADM